MELGRRWQGNAVALEDHLDLLLLRGGEERGEAKEEEGNGGSQGEAVRPGGKERKKSINSVTKLRTQKLLTPIHPVDILLSRCSGLASVGSSTGDSTARGSSMALGSSVNSSGSATPTFSLGGENDGEEGEENSSSASSPPPLPGTLGPRLLYLSAA